LYREKNTSRNVQPSSPKSGSKLPTTRIEIKTDRSIDIKAVAKSSARKNQRESKRKDSVRIIFISVLG